MVNGFIIQNADGAYLSKGRYWYRHADPSEAFVHPPEALPSIKHASATWDVPPKTMTAATYTPGKAIVLDGDPQPF